jgi:hypothetical protein
MKSDLHDLKNSELMENGSSKFRNQQKSYKIYGSKENDSEIDFEEEPRTALMASQNNEETYQETTIIFCRKVEEEEEY